jgi:hypothetical protein
MGLMPSDEEIRIAITALANTKDAIKNIQALEKSISITTNSADRMKMATTGAVSPKLADQAIKSKYALDDMNKSVKETNKGFSSMINVIKGALTAMLTLAALRKVTEFFTNALKSAQEFRAQLIQLNFSEVILSQRGMDITRKELDDFIADIESRYKYLSKLDATKVVSETAGAVQEFDVSKQQLGELSDAIAYIQLQNKLLGREEADAAHIINAAMDARSNFFNGMGINITETIVKEKAYAMELAKVGEELTKQQRFQAILALLTEQTSGKQEELIAALEGTPLGNQLKFQKEYADTLELVGEQLLTVKDKFIELFTNLNANGEVGRGLVSMFSDLATEINNTIDTLNSAVEAIRILENTFGGAEDAGESWWESFADAINPLENILFILQTLGALLASIIILPVTFWANILSGKGVGTAVKQAGIEVAGTFVEGFSTALETLLGDEQGKIASWVKSTWKSLTGVDIDLMHTPEAPTPPEVDTPSGATMAEGIDAESDNVQQAVEEMREKVLDEYQKMQQDIEDATVDFNRKMDDISSEYQFKRIDAERDYQDKVQDINRDANRKIQDISIKQQQDQAKARQEALDKEREYQNKLLEMRENFLMDLDDALHARDARQILKLIKNYNLEKTQAQRQRDLQKAEDAAAEKLRQQSYEAERKQAEAERQRKLEDAAIEHQRKLDQLAEDEERERIQAQLALQRKMADLQLEMGQRLALLGAGLVAEFNLTKAGLDAILALYQAYYGPGGAIDQVYQGAQARMASTSTLSPGANPKDPQSQPGGYGHGKGGSSYAFAEGGSLLVNKPTRVLMGEGGVPELGQFTPIGKAGTNVNKIFSNMSGAGGEGAGGRMEIGLSLSPDLEARIISNSMKETAKVIVKVNRSK